MGESVHVDEVMLVSLKELLADKFTDLVEAYINDCEQRLERMSKAMVGLDLTVLKDEAHGIKGSSRNMGANSLAELCAVIEDQARAGDSTGFEQKISGVEQLFAAVKAELEGLIA